MSTPYSPSPEPGTEPLDYRKALITQLSVGPSFREVAATLLRQSLQQLYPSLDIDPDLTVMGTPTWELVDDQIVAGPTHYQALSDLLAKQAVTAIPTLCIEGEHFLTQTPVTEPAVHLPMRIVDISKTLNTLAPAMLDAFQEQQVAYWNQSNGNGPHWHTLSSTLGSAWNVQHVTPWNATDCAMARSLYRAPDKADRQANDPYNSKAYLIDVDLLGNEHVRHLSEIALAVLVGQHEGKDIVLSYSLLKGYEKFDSLEQLGQSLPSRLVQSQPPKDLQWRLFEPDGNFFDQLACALIALQIKAIDELDFSDTRQTGMIDEPLPTSRTSMQGATTPMPDLSWYHDALPTWLEAASTSDLNLYARYLKDLAALHRLNAGRSFQDGIAAIGDYALDTLKTEIVKDHPNAAHLALEQIDIQVQSPVVWGTFVVPGQTQTTTFSLVDLALQNLIALPLGNKTLRLRNGRTAPAWLTVDYIEALVKRVDIGKTYPALIKRQLLDNPQESSRRKTLYTQHLRLQLPLLALHSKIRQQNGIDARGYRYIAALMQPAPSQVDGQAIVLRHLAFMPKRRTSASQDLVANMYLIGPQDSASGPCLLYRPLFEPPLVQYASPANLLYAITQSAELRSSVLAWLPDTVRDDYANYVFPGGLPSPWAVADVLVDADKLSTLSGPMALGEQVLSGDIFANLFTANAKALIQLADHQSVSNAEARWASFKQAGWRLFNGVLPFLNPAVGTAVWIWQVVDQLQQFVEAHEQGKRQEQWAALTDVLLNLGMAITLHVTARNLRPGERPKGKSKPPPPPPTQPHNTRVEQLTTLATHELPTGHRPSLNANGAITRKPDSLRTLVDSFKVTKPEGLSTPITQEGTYQHLYRLNDHYYAPVGERWFKVQVEEDGPVVMIDPKQPGRSGPPLIHNARGQWFIDTRLRLLGGGPKRVVKKAISDATLRANELREKLETFERSKKKLQQELQHTHQAMVDAPGTSADAKRQLYLHKLEDQEASYETALQQLKTLNVFSPSADFQPKSVACIKAQLELAEAGIREAQTTFTPQFRTVLEQVAAQSRQPQARHVDDAVKMLDLNQDMIRRLDYIQSRFTELRRLALEGIRLIQDSKKRMPAYSSNDLKALRLTMSRNLCLKKDTINTHPGAWTSIDQIVDTLDVTFQTLRDTLDERSESRLDERIEALNSVIEQFTIIDERLEDFAQEFESVTVPEQLEDLRKEISGFSQHALSQLALLHAERDILRNRPTPPPSPPRPIKKFIRTRYNGMLIGEPRLTPIGLETGLVDIKSPFTQQIIATYHQKDQGQWVQHITASEPQPLAPDIQTCIDYGQAHLNGLLIFKRRATAQISNAARTPVGIEYLFHQHALLLEQADQAIEQALTRDNITENQSRSATLVSKQLKEATSQLYQQATQHMLQMTKQRPPTVEGLEWLKSRNAISIKKTKTRQRLKSPRPLYVDEYTISDRSTHSPLWYAQFHYSSTWTTARTFLFARLKTAAQLQQGSDADQLKGLNKQQQIDYYHSAINAAQAQRLFFNL